MRRFRIYFLNQPHIFGDLTSHVERNVQKTRDMIHHENLIFPRDFFILPWFRIKRVAATGWFYELVIHILNCITAKFARAG